MSRTELLSATVEFTLQLSVFERLALAVVLGTLFVFIIAIQFARLRILFGSSDSETEEKRVNCPSCGSRTPAAAETCEYCDEPLAQEEETHRDRTFATER